MAVVDGSARAHWTGIRAKRLIVADRRDNRKRGTWVGIGMIVLGALGALVGYVQDGDSLDYLRMMRAGDFAILHLVLWTIAGLLVIGWYNLPTTTSNGEE